MDNTPLLIHQIQLNPTTELFIAFLVLSGGLTGGVQLTITLCFGPGFLQYTEVLTGIIRSSNRTLLTKGTPLRLLAVLLATYCWLIISAPNA